MNVAYRDRYNCFVFHIVYSKPSEKKKLQKPALPNTYNAFMFHEHGVLFIEMQ